MRPGVFPQDPGASFPQAPSCFAGYWRTTKGALGWPHRLRGRAETLTLEEAGGLHSVSGRRAVVALPGSADAHVPVRSSSWQNTVCVCRAGAGGGALPSPG